MRRLVFQISVSATSAELFSWVAGRRIDKEQAMQCAKREPGRSWEAMDSELARLGKAPSFSNSGS